MATTLQAPVRDSPLFRHLHLLVAQVVEYLQVINCSHKASNERRDSHIGLWFPSESARPSYVTEGRSGYGVVALSQDNA